MGNKTLSWQCCRTRGFALIRPTAAVLHHSAVPQPRSRLTCSPFVGNMILFDALNQTNQTSSGVMYAVQSFSPVGLQGIAAAMHPLATLDWSQNVDHIHNKFVVQIRCVVIYLHHVWRLECPLVPNRILLHGTPIRLASAYDTIFDASIFQNIAIIGLLILPST